MHQTTKNAIVFLVLVPFTVACGSGVGVVRSPTAPTASAPPAAATSVTPASQPPSQRWRLTRTLKSVAGPETCSDFVERAAAGTGRSTNWSMVIQRPAESIRLILTDDGDPTEHWQYDGAVAGETFTVNSPPFLGWLVCKGTMVPYSAQEVITGRFAGDGRTSTGDEVDTYQLSGEALSYHFQWSATQID